MKNLKDACAECELLIEFLSEEEKSKISKSFLAYLEKNKNPNYVPEIDFEKSLENQEFKKETYALLAVVYLKYLCKDDAQRVELIKFLKDKN